MFTSTKSVFHIDRYFCFLFGFLAVLFSNGCAYKMLISEVDLHEVADKEKLYAKFKVCPINGGAKVGDYATFGDLRLADYYRDNGAEIAASLQDKLLMKREIEYKKPVVRLKRVAMALLVYPLAYGTILVPGGLLYLAGAPDDMVVIVGGLLMWPWTELVVHIFEKKPEDYEFGQERVEAANEFNKYIREKLGLTP